MMSGEMKILKLRRVKRNIKKTEKRKDKRNTRGHGYERMEVKEKSRKDKAKELMYS